MLATRYTATIAARTPNVSEASLEVWLLETGKADLDPIIFEAALKQINGIPAAAQDCLSCGAP